MKRYLGRLLAATAICTGVASTAAAADFEWKFFTIYGVSDKQSDWLRGFAKDVADKTGGKLNITLFTGSELPYKGTDVYRAISRRQVEMGHSVTGFMAADQPLLEAMTMPFVCSDIDKFYEKVLPAIRPTFDQAIEEKFGATPLIHWAMPGQNLFTTKDVQRLTDFKGMKIRTWNQGQVQTMDKLGATSVSLTTAEVTPSLQRGVIDGAITAASNADAWSWHEVLRHGYMFNITLSHEVISVNNQALSELPDDVRKGLMEAAAEWGGKLRYEVSVIDSKARENLTAKGITLVEVTPEDKAEFARLTAPIADDWAKAQGAKGEEVLGAIRANCQ